MNIDEIMDMAKERLLDSGMAGHRILAEFPHQDSLGLAVFPLMWNGDKEKEIIRKAVKAQLLKMNAIRYWFASEIWMSAIDYKNPDKVYVKPSRDAAREEAVIVLEYNSNGEQKSRIQMFRHDKSDKIEFYDHPLQNKMEMTDSYWNIWEDEEELHKKDQAMIQKINETFLRNMSHKIAEKYKAEFFATDDPEERLKVIHKILEAGMEEKKKMNQKILEDTDDD